MESREKKTAGERRIGVAILVALLAAAGVGAGLRIGGYGFRAASGGTLNWADCRMNGVPVHAHGATADGKLLKYEVAGQGQFFVRYVF